MGGDVGLTQGVIVGNDIGCHFAVTAGDGTEVTLGGEVGLLLALILRSKAGVTLTLRSDVGVSQ